MNLPSFKTGAASRAFGALAIGAVAIGALAVGAIAIGRLAIDHARIRRLEIDELVVRRLRVTEALQVPPAPVLRTRYVSRAGTAKARGLEM